MKFKIQQNEKKKFEKRKKKKHLTSFSNMKKLQEVKIELKTSK